MVILSPPFCHLPCYLPYSISFSYQFLTCPAAQYSEYFYVNLYTKKSQWEKPTEPVYPPNDSHLPPDAPPPSYTGSGDRLSSNNPYSGNTGAGRSSNDITEDERLARKLQAEEEERARTHGSAGAAYPNPGGSSNAYYQGGQPYAPQQGQGYGSPSSNPPQQQQHDSKGKGLLGKLLSKASAAGSSHSRPQGYSYPHQPAYGGYGSSAYGHSYPPHGMYGGGYGGGYGRRPGGGMGMAGAGALGLGGGLLGGAMLANAADAGDHGGYGDDGGGDYGGGDYGGGDYGGGDMGGDMGGGDFGGGDMGGGDF